MPTRKSIFRQPGATHFQLVHRSQRDPLIHDPDINQHVLKPFERENAKKGKTRKELESILSSEIVENDKRRNVGEAALYGIYYNDTEYDYMQHLRPVGVQEDGVESILIEAPSARKSSGKRSNLDLPQSVFASKTELPSNYQSQQAIPESIAGFQPDMDPHLRQVLEALEDDTFVEENLDDDFFGELVKDGERASDEEVSFGESEQLEGHYSPHANGQEFRVDATWEEQFAHFKKTQASSDTADPNSDEFASEVGDSVHGLPTVSVIGGKGRRRRKGSSEASGYSMSSSSMYRNEALQTLDERFNQMMLKEYDEVQTASEEELDADEAPELITSREDFEGMMNEFINKYEVLGRKMQAKLPGDSGADKLDTLRHAMGRDRRVLYQEDNDKEGLDLVRMEVQDKRDRWDCETILSTYSNLENHPRLIPMRTNKSVPKIFLNPKSGLPVVKETTDNEHINLENKKCVPEIPDIKKAVHYTITRNRDESREEKKLRKGAAKVEKQMRRTTKRETKEQYGAEIKAQKKSLEGRMMRERLRRL
ncbi:hypothetical protein AMATHDRAFT_189929 [Amanita thiersii Skay4041]|uniref:Protein LTV1 n=1 Tax=Amanita thiersii Skay4041 TaxID=703135 RepID=A0A2A9NX47_9AGAR|nr:hypothetical protein AMATHDRAFT_189929 [Amanita thiersii Skay4041]